MRLRTFGSLFVAAEAATVALIGGCSAQECDPKTGVCDRDERCPIVTDDGVCLHEQCPISCGNADNNSNNSDSDEEEECKDLEPRCSGWAKSGECAKNPQYMHFNCAKSCQTCDKVVSKKNDKAANDLIDRSQEFGERQFAGGGERAHILERLQSTLDYLASEEVVQLPYNVRKTCKNRDAMCTQWQVVGECEKNMAYMALQCAAACHSCNMIDPATRCSKNENAVSALTPGDMDKMFERIIATAPGNQTSLSIEDQRTLYKSRTPLYTVHVHSRPFEHDNDNDNHDKLSSPPWVLTFDNFLTEQECDTMVQLGYKNEFKRSVDVGMRKFDGTYDSKQSVGRTSENAWCGKECRDEGTPKLLHERMSRVMGIPPQNSEDLQLLKYEVGQFYHTHHDYISHQRDRPCGPRILTFFLYLSDVEAGGGTNFPSLNMTIEPKKGRALLWPSVLNSDPTRIDPRMRHQALPVEKGTKFAANGWIHLHDYVEAHNRGCT